MRTRTVSYAGTDEELFREQMRSSAQGDGAHPRTFGYLLTKAAETKVWERLLDPGGRKFRTFRDFLVAPDPYGLGMTVDELRHAVALAGDEAKRAVETLLRDEIKRAREHGTNQHSAMDGERTTLSSETAERHIRRLKRDDPDLAAKVVAGEMSAYAAARAKGWRPPRIQVTTPERTAAQLRKHLTTEQLSTLARLLTEG